QAEDGIRDFHVTGVQTCALPISTAPRRPRQRVWGETGQRERPSPRPRTRRESSLVIPEPRNSRVRFDFDRRALERAEDRNRRRGRVTFEVPEIDWRREDRAAQISLNVAGPLGQKYKRSRGQRREQARSEERRV